MTRISVLKNCSMLMTGGWILHGENLIVNSPSANFPCLNETLGSREMRGWFVWRVFVLKLSHAAEYVSNGGQEIKRPPLYYFD